MRSRQAVMAIDGLGFGEHAVVKNRRGGEPLILKDEPFAPIGRVRIIDKRTGATVFYGENKAMLSWSEFAALRMFDIEGDGFVTPTYNTQMDLDQSQLNSGNDLGLGYKVYLFCIGTSGCAVGSQIKFEVSNKSWIEPNDMVPFRYQSVEDDLDDVLRTHYFGRKTMLSRNRIAYYFKRFDSDPIVSKVYEDGSPWTSSVYSDQTSLSARVKVDLTCTVDEDDGRDWFDQTSGINDARFNCLQLLSAWPAQIDGYTYFQDVRPVTRLNFPNRVLSELGDSWEIRYSLIL